MAIAGTILLIVSGFWGCRMSQGASPTEPALAPKEAKAAEAEAAVTIPAKGDEPAAPATAESGDTAKAASPDTLEDKTGALLVVHVSGVVKRPGVYTLKTGDRIYHAVRAAGGFKSNAWQEALNLADQLQDADQIIVPSKDDMGPPVPVRPAPSGVISAAAPAHGSAPALAAVAVAPAAKPRPRGRVLGKTPVAALPARSAASALAVPVVAAAVPVGGSASASGETASAGKSSKLKNPGDGVVNINTAGSEDLQKLPGVGPATPST